MTIDKTVLVIEDDSSQQKALQQKIKKAGFVTLSADNGEEGLRVALESHPDAIILDVLMPKMGGIEMIKQLRNDRWGAGVPVIMLTNYSKAETLQQAMESNVFDFFIKSDVNIDTIVEKVSELIENKQGSA